MDQSVQARRELGTRIARLRASARKQIKQEHTLSQGRGNHAAVE
jgi:hypothetical protein